MKRKLTTPILCALSNEFGIQKGKTWKSRTNQKVIHGWYVIRMDRNFVIRGRRDKTCNADGRSVVTAQ